MIEHIWSVLCQSASIDVQDGRISMFDVIEVLNLKGDPDKISRIPFHSEIVSLWIRTDPEIPARGKIRTTLVKPDGTSNKPNDLDFDIGDSLFLRSRMRIGSIGLAGPGLYQFEVSIKEENSEEWQTVSNVPLVVNFFSISEVKDPQENLAPEK